MSDIISKNLIEEYSRLNFSIFENVEDLITGADVVVSCVTVAHGQFASDTCFKSRIFFKALHELQLLPFIRQKTNVQRPL